jgi:hypothetical protein
VEAIEEMSRANSRVKASRQWTGILALVVVVAGCGGSTASSSQTAPSGRLTPTSESTSPTAPTSPESATAAYLATLNLDQLLTHSASYEAPRFSGNPTTYIDGLRGTLRGVDRVAVLRAVFERLTAGLQSETEKEHAVLGFVQELSVHDFSSPFMSIPIFDPLILFQIGAMDCQRASRLIVDLYAAAAYRGRVVDFYGHAVAEISYDGGWHYADADMFGGGDIVTFADGHIPSVAELSRQHQILDRLPVYLENVVQATYGSTGKNGGSATWTYPSSAYFSAQYFAGNPGYPVYLTRKAFPATATDPSLDFGWTDANQLERAPASDIVLSDISSQVSPNAPSIEAVSTTAGTIRISVAADPAATVSGYRVFVSSTSRGWDYGNFLGSTAAKSDWANPSGWAAGMYSRLFQVPPSDVARVDSNGPNIVVSGLGPGTYFVSVMPRDSYGDSVGRELYPSSNELKVTVS